ncbi:hypothetical protein [Algoriphagus persicinus]|uniref:hypothetical protein n=1 Tax=Algoriphagus persicinus TaxID=3108754 RepID=UPI002B3D43E6|nr:hypothetical protein [Algoriphagus sp. E1-3-M2]MEB2785911.1 hypothetical protein [Algoriphagus sp. E1-3-M2]
MKSSMTQASHRGMIINHARFQVTLKTNYKHMKSSMSKNDTQKDDYLPCEIPSRFLRHGTGYGL